MAEAITPTPEKDFNDCVQEKKDQGLSTSDCFRLIKFGKTQAPTPAGATGREKIIVQKEEDTPSPSGRSFTGQYYDPYSKRTGSSLGWSWRGL